MPLLNNENYTFIMSFKNIFDQKDQKVKNFSPKRPKMMINNAFRANHYKTCVTKIRRISFCKNALEKSAFLF